MTEGEKFIRNAKCKHGHQSSMSISAWCDLKKHCTVLKLQDICHNPECNCEKQITFTPNQFQSKGSGVKNTMKKIFKGTEKMWNNSIKPGLKIASPIISAGVAAKTKNPQSAQITSNVSKSIKCSENR